MTAPVLTLPYREEERYRTNGTATPVFRPTVDVTIRHLEATWTTRVLVDPSAPVTVFDRGAADALGIEFREDGRKVERHRLGGNERVAQREHVRLGIDGLPEWEADVAFLVDEWNTGWNLRFGGVLGTRGFLDRHVVTFDGARQLFVVEAAT